MKSAGTNVMCMLVGRPRPSKKLLMAFLFKAGNHARKYHYGPGFQNHLVAKMAFDLEGQIQGQKVK